MIYKIIFRGVESQKGKYLNVRTPKHVTQNLVFALQVLVELNGHLRNFSRFKYKIIKSHIWLNHGVPVFYSFSDSSLLNKVHFEGLASQTYHGLLPFQLVTCTSKCVHSRAQANWSSQPSWTEGFKYLHVFHFKVYYLVKHSTYLVLSMFLCSCHVSILNSFASILSVEILHVP